MKQKKRAKLQKLTNAKCLKAQKLKEEGLTWAEVKERMGLTMAASDCPIIT